MRPSDILILRGIVNAAPPGYDTLRAHAVLDRAGDDAKELERLRAVIRGTHKSHCEPMFTEYASAGRYCRHAPECLLYEVEP